eukprot:8947320-Heterocapsa_arctica.AAC.1
MATTPTSTSGSRARRERKKKICIIRTSLGRMWITIRARVPLGGLPTTWTPMVAGFSVPVGAPL